MCVYIYMYIYIYYIYIYIMYLFNCTGFSMLIQECMHRYLFYIYIHIYISYTDVHLCVFKNNVIYIDFNMHLRKLMIEFHIT